MFWLLCSMWVPPGPGIKPMSLALAGGVFTTEPPGNPWKRYFSFGRRYRFCRMTVAFKEMSLFFLLHNCVCAFFWEWERREGGSAPEPAEGSWLFSGLVQWGWGVFQAGCCWELARPQGPSSGEARPVVLREAVIKSHAGKALLVPGVGGQDGDGGKTRFSGNEGVGTVKGWGSRQRGRFEK